MYQHTAFPTNPNHYNIPDVPSLFYTAGTLIQSPQFVQPGPSDYLRPFPPQRYVAVAVIVVYIDAIKGHEIRDKIPMVARVSITDYRGTVLLDTYVRPTHPVNDYRTNETGLQYAHLYDAPLFQDVQQWVADTIRDKIIIGHGLWEFLSVLGLSHPALETRDLALFRPLRKRLKSRAVINLPTLIYLFMARKIGLDYENSVEMARAAVDLFRSCEVLFEEIIERGAWPCDLPPLAFAEYYS